jgi:hypothetical protein
VVCTRSQAYQTRPADLQHIRYMGQSGPFDVNSTWRTHSSGVSEDFSTKRRKRAGDNVSNMSAQRPASQMDLFVRLSISPR